MTPQQAGFLADIESLTFKIVPEPDSALGTLAFGIGGTLLLLKSQMNKKKQR